MQPHGCKHYILHHWCEKRTRPTHTRLWLQNMDLKDNLFYGNLSETDDCNCGWRLCLGTRNLWTLSPVLPKSCNWKEKNDWRNRTYEMSSLTWNTLKTPIDVNNIMWDTTIFEISVDLYIVWYHFIWQHNTEVSIWHYHTEYTGTF